MSTNAPSLCRPLDMNIAYLLYCKQRSMLQTITATINNSRGRAIVANNVYQAKFLERAERFIRGLDENDRAKIAAAIRTMELGGFQSVEIKALRGPIKELIVRSYRIIFFISKNHTIYFVSGFRKKTRKTPKHEINYAQNVFRILNK